MDLHCCRQSGAHYAEVSLMSQWSLTDGLESDLITSHLEQLHILAFFFVASFTHFIALFYTPPHSTQYSKDGSSSSKLKESRPHQLHRLREPVSDIHKRRP